MAKRLLAVLILTALIGANCDRFFVCTEFDLNHKYIAENLCINKARPWLHCNGRCYFMKKIKQAEEEEKRQERQDQKSRYQEALPVAETVYKLSSTIFEVKPTYGEASTKKPVSRSYTILQPPKVA